MVEFSQLVVVSGRVLSSAGLPAPQVQLTLLEAPLRGKPSPVQGHDAVATGSDGRYAFTLDLAPFWEAGQLRPHFVLEVSRGGVRLQSQALTVAGADRVELDFVVSDAPAGAESRFASLQRRLQAYLPAGLALHDLSVEEAARLAERSGVSGAEVERLVGSERAALEDEVIPPAAFFALGVRLGGDGLEPLAARPEVLQASLDAAIGAGTISKADLGGALEDLLVPLSDKGAASLLNGPIDVEGTRWYRVALDAAGLDDAQKQAVLRVALQSGFGEELWGALEAQEFDPQLVDGVRHARQALHVVSGSPFAATRLLARAANPTGWAGLDAEALDAIVALDAGEVLAVPHLVPGADDEERRRNWARLIGRRIEEAAPAATFAAKVLRSADNVVATPELRNLFENNGAVDLSAIEDVATFVHEDAVLDDGVDRDVLEAQVTGLRRLLAVSPRFDTALALRQEGVSSAYDIASIELENLVFRFGEELGRDEVESVHLNARVAAGFALSLEAEYARNGLWFDTNVATRPSPPATTANLQSLFGSTGICDCEHCLSVHGPAAYLVDLLDFARNLMPAELGYEFRGNGEHIRFGAFYFTNRVEELTLAFWVRKEGAWVAGQSLLSRADAAADQQIELHTFGQGGLRVRLQLDNGNMYSAAVDQVLQPDRWHHVALVRRRFGSASRLEWWIDGQRMSFTGIPSTLTSVHAAPLRIGAGYPGAQTFGPGRMAAIGVWNRALDEEHIRALYGTGTTFWLFAPAGSIPQPRFFLTPSPSDRRGFPRIRDQGGRAGTAQGGMTVDHVDVADPLDVLRGRRADLTRIQLSCENANTELPYLDLVNEHLEAAIITIKTGQAPPPVTATTGTTEERRAYPQRILPNVYTDYLARETFPHRALFDLWTAETRAYLEMAGRSRAELMDVLAAELPPARLSSAPRAYEELGLTPRLAEILTVPGLIDTPSNWGFEVQWPQALVTLGSLGELIRRSDSDYEDLLEIFDTRFVRGGEAGPVIQRSLGECDVDAMSVQGLTQGVALRLQLLLRLRLRLGWHAFELDRVLTAIAPAYPDLGDAASNRAALVRLALVKRLAERWSVRPALVAHLFAARLDDHAYRRADGSEDPGLFTQAFLQVSVSGQAVNPLAAPPAGATFADARDELLAGTSLDESSLSVLLPVLFAGAQVLDRVPLTRENVTRLWALASVARWSGTSPADIVRYIRLTGIDPCTPGAPERAFELFEHVERILQSPLEVSEVVRLLLGEPKSRAAEATEATDLDTLLEVLATDLPEPPSPGLTPADGASTWPELAGRIDTFGAGLAGAVVDQLRDAITHRSAWFPTAEIAAFRAEIPNWCIVEDQPNQSRLVVDGVLLPGQSSLLRGLVGAAAADGYFAAVDEIAAAPAQALRAGRAQGIVFLSEAVIAQLLALPPDSDPRGNITFESRRSGLEAALRRGEQVRSWVVDQLAEWTGLEPEATRSLGEYVREVRRGRANPESALHRLLEVSFGLSRPAEGRDTLDRLLRLGRSFDALGFASSDVRWLLETRGAGGALATLPLRSPRSVARSVHLAQGTRLDAGHVALEGREAFTVLLDITPDTLAHQSPFSVLEQVDPAGPKVDIDVRARDTGHLEIRVGDPVGTSTQDPVLQVNQRARIAVVYDGRAASRVRVFIEGVEAVVPAGGAPARVPDYPAGAVRPDLRLSRADDSGFTGTIHGVAILDRAVTAPEIAALQAERPAVDLRGEPGLLMWLDMREGPVVQNTRTIVDESGAGHDGRFVADAGLRIDTVGLPLPPPPAAYGPFTQALRLAIVKAEIERPDVSLSSAWLAPETSAYTELLADLLAVPTQDLELLRDLFARAHGVEAPRDPDSTWWMWKATRALRSLGVAAERALRWLVGPAPAPTHGPWVWPTQATADDVRNAARARFEAETWLEHAADVRDGLRVRQRDALVSYLTHDEACVADPVIGSRTQEELYGRLLIDNQMGPAVSSTRIVQALSAVQLFLQRCGLNLERFALTPGMRDRWTWMKSYRVWEANRKIFLYPENWLEPGLRDDKTPIFEALEGGLVEGPPSEAALEQLVARYLEQLEEVADPEVIGMFHEVQIDSANVLMDRLHIVARTRSQPRRFFYRSKELEWGAWEQLDVDMDPATHDAVPAVLRGRLFVFWFEVKAIPVDNQPSGAAGNYSLGNARTQLRVRLAWTERRADGWLPKRVSETAVQIPERTYLVAGSNSPEPAGLSHKLVEVKECLEAELRINDSGVPWILGRVAEEDSEKADEQFFKGYYYHELFGFEFSPVSGRVRARTNQTGSCIEPHFYEFDPNPNLRWDYRGFLFHDQSIETITGTTRMSPKGCAQEPQLSPRHPVALLGGEGETLLVEARIDRRPRGAAGAAGPENARALMSDAVTTPAPTPSSISELRFEPESRTSLSLPTSAIGPGSVPVKRGTITDFPLLPYGVPVTIWRMNHAFIAAFRSLLDRGGVRALVSRVGQHRASLLDVQEATEVPGEHRTYNVEAPSWDVQFATGEPNAPYNTELFLHIPLRIAEHLTRERRFEEALSWLQLVFNPTASAEETGTGRFWGYRPFQELEDNPDAHALLHALGSSSTAAQTVARRDRVFAQIEAWLARPFRPFVIARLRPGALQRAVVFAYLDLIIAWGDDLFRQDTREAINEATQLYVLAHQILGERPQRVPGARFVARSYDDLSAGAFGTAPQGLLDVVPTPGVRYLPPVSPAGGGTAGAAVASASKGALYFCIPPNPRLLRYWDTIEDRLFKIHNSLDIEGVERTLALFAPPIPPGLIARALASGLSLGEAIRLGRSVSRPRHRFGFMLRRAMELVLEVRALGQQMLGALERRDGERVALLRASQERDALELGRRSRELSLTEVGEQLEAARRSKQAVLHRQAFYRDRTPRLAKEERQVALIKSNQRLTLSAGLFEDLASKLGLVPRMKAGAQGMSSPEATLAIGLQEMAGLLSGMGRHQSLRAQVESSQASLASAEANWERRDEEWRFQVEAADHELAQLERQIASAEIRVELARRALVEHDAEMARSKAREDELRNKFSTEQLYDWMVKECSGVYFQLYELALDASRKAEAAFRYETGARDAVFLKPAYWDSLRKGLLAADQLQLDLRRMELAFYDQDVRELELTKHVSLALHAPDALRRIQEGHRSVEVDLPELLFDMDYPGHYRRRLRAVQVTLPTVTGPYASVSCTMTLESSVVRWTPQVATPPEQQVIRVESIVTSTGVQDGMVDARAEDGRYLPFEGAGAISRWRIDIPQATNDFDLRDLADVVLHLRYVARDGGPALRAEAETRVAALERARLLSSRREASDAWAAFEGTAAGDASLEVTLDESTLPIGVRANGVQISRLVVFAVPRDAPANVDAMLTPPAGAAAQPLALTTAAGAWATAAAAGPLTAGTWRLEVPVAVASTLHDLLWLVTYAEV